MIGRIKGQENNKGEDKDINGIKAQKTQIHDIYIVVFVGPCTDSNRR